MTWRVLPRGLVALFGSLVFSIAFAIAIGHPEFAILTWTFTFAWLTWVWPPPPKTSRPRWWYARVAVKLLAWILVIWFSVWVAILLITLI